MAPVKSASTSRPSATSAAQQLTGSAALRAQLHEEIEERSRACGHPRYACHLPRLPGWTRCSQHILQEPTAPYRRCSVPRCGQPAPRHHADELCLEHACAALAGRMRATAPPTRAPGPESLLLGLAHHVTPERTRTESCTSQVSVVSDSPETEAPLLCAPDPFKQINAHEVNASIGPDVLDCWSSGSDSESPLCRGPGADEDSSGAEDTPLDAEPLRFAGIYTCEEAVVAAGSALRRLQGLYLGQLRGLARSLREARRFYLANLKVERETNCSIHAQGATSGLERRQLAELKASASYRKRHGVDAVLYRKLHEKRAKVTEGSVSQRGPPHGRCCFAEGGVKCWRAALPAARHCPRHILHDRHQVLFRECGATRAGVECHEPTHALSCTTTCRLHTELPPYQTYSLKKYESDSEDASIGTPAKDSSGGSAS